MNTLSDTDEGRTRPLVGLVYAMSALIGIISVGLVAMMGLAVWLRALLPEYAAPSEMFSRHRAMPAFVILTGLFGILVAVGASRLRPWGWWAVVVWAALYLVVAMPDLATFWQGGVSSWAIAEVSLLACVALVLIMSRRLFFPPKPAGEE